jgi:hypothetical protein
MTRCRRSIARQAGGAGTFGASLPAQAPAFKAAARGIGATMDYGFYGIFARHDDPHAALVLANAAIAKETGCTAECSKKFLESYRGRLFALGVTEELDRLFAEGVIKERKSTNALKSAIDGAIAKLMHHPISREDASVYGIPAGPYLKGFACHCKLGADTGEGRVLAEFGHS